MALKPSAPVKPKKSKEQRCREQAVVIYASAVARVGEIVERMESPPTMQQINRMLQNRFDMSINAAEIFENGWERVRGRFSVDELED